MIGHQYIGSQARMKLSIVIVNYKTPQLLLQCIEGIKATTIDIVYEIIIVDNASNDESESLITSSFNDVIWINNSRNEGFGRGNNVGINKASGQFILMLNSDIILEEFTIIKCLDEIQNDESIGALSCQLLNENGTPQKSTYTGNGNAMDLLMSNLILDYLLKLNARKKKVRAMMGSFMLIPKKVFEKVGLFDPDYFMYSEEIDLCRRIEKGNYKLVYFQEVSAIHMQGGSSSGEEWSWKQKLLSNALLQYKSRGIFNYLLYHFIFFFNAVSNFMVMWLLDKRYRHRYWLEKRYYLSNMLHFLTIPLLYPRKIGDGSRLLRRN